jgi:hypothetical protein
MASPKIEKKLLGSSQLRLHRGTQKHRNFLYFISVQAEALLWPLLVFIIAMFVVVVVRAV